MSRTVQRSSPPVPINRHRRRGVNVEDQRPQPPQQPRDPGDDLRIAERREKVLNLTRSGISMRKIAAQVGCDVRIVWEDIHTELAASAELRKNEVEVLRELELQRLNDLQAGLTIKARSGDAYAADVLRKVSESRRKLLGLDAPTKVAPTTPDGEKPYETADLSKLSAATLKALELELGAGEARP